MTFIETAKTLLRGMAKLLNELQFFFANTFELLRLINEKNLLR